MLKVIALYYYITKIKNKNDYALFDTKQLQKHINKLKNNHT